MASFHAEKCCHVVNAYAATTRHVCSSVRQFLIHSRNTFVAVTFTVVVVAGFVVVVVVAGAV